MTQKSISPKLDNSLELWVCLACGEKYESRTGPPRICACGVVDAFGRGEVIPRRPGNTDPGVQEIESVPLGEVRALARGRKTGIAELDRSRLLGAGIPDGIPILLYGPSTGGKSTLAIQIVAAMGRPGLLVVPEMSEEVAKTIANRSGADLSGFRLYRGALEAWPAEADRVGARAVLVDSVSKFPRPDEALETLIDWARRSGAVAVAIAHESRRGKPLLRAEYEPDCVLRLTRRGARRTVEVQKCRWSGRTGTVQISSE